MSSLLIQSLVQHHLSRTRPIQLRDFPLEHTLERSRFRSGPGQTAPKLLELPNYVTPPSFTIGLPEGFQNYKAKNKNKKNFQSGTFSYPRKCCTQLQTFHLTLSMLMINIRESVTFRQFFGRRSTTKTITPRVAQPTSTLTTQPSLHHVKEGRAKDARGHDLVRQLFHTHRYDLLVIQYSRFKANDFRSRLRYGIRRQLSDEDLN